MDVTRRQSIRDRQGKEPAVVHAREAGFAAYPQDIVAIDEQREDPIAREPGRVARVIDREARSIEARQTSEGANPQVAVPSLGNRRHGDLGQALLRLPYLPDHTVGRLQEVKRMDVRAVGAANQQGEGHDERGGASPSACDLSHRAMIIEATNGHCPDVAAHRGTRPRRWNHHLMHLCPRSTGC